MIERIFNMSPVYTHRVQPRRVEELLNLSFWILAFFVQALLKKMLVLGAWEFRFGILWPGRV